MSGWIRGVRAEDKARVQVIEERVAELGGHLNALHGGLAVLVGELHGLGGCGDLSAARWLGWRLGCGAGPAVAVAAVAARVEELAVTVGALQRGELSVDQAAAIARHAARLCRCRGPWVRRLDDGGPAVAGVPGLSPFRRDLLNPRRGGVRSGSR